MQLPRIEPFRGDAVATLARELDRVRARTDALFAQVPDRDMFERPIAQRHRLAFYLGHLEAFDVNLLLRDASRPHALDPLDHRFAFGIDPTDGALPSDKPQDWPSLEDIRRYARRTRARVDEGVAALSLRGGDALLHEKLHSAVEHRWMHAETLAYLLNRTVADKPIRPVPPNLRAIAQTSIAIPAGDTWLGQRDGFGWDNEFGAHRVHVPAFRIDRCMVTNGDFLRFVEAGGYHSARHWSPADWRWREREAIAHPASWTSRKGAWLLVSHTDLVPFQADWPVVLSHAEASAYAAWVGARLPTEAEWMRAAYGDDDRPYPWGCAPVDGRHANADFARWDPMPVDAHPQGASPWGVQGLVGNAWEWTRTVFAPFAGFCAAGYYPGYSADFFDDAHYVMKGGSAHTATALLRRSFRNWFQPHYPYVFAGFRCVTSP